MKTYSYFYLILLTMLHFNSYAQSGLEKVTLNQDDNYYFEKLKALIKDKKVPGQADSIFVSSNTELYKITILQDETILGVPYLDEKSNCFFSICKTGGFPHILFIQNDSNHIDERLIGNEIKHIYIKEIGYYKIYFIYEYVKDQTRENFLEYFTVIQNTENCSYSFRNFIEWQESPQGSFGGPLKTIFQSSIELVEEEDDFYVLQKVKMPNKVIRRFKFVEGEFIEVKN